jgi:hypothetical protein
MDRRDFLASVAGAAALAASPALAQPKAKLKGRIKQGLWKVNFGADTKLTFDQECQIAARLGLKGFDVIPDKDWPTLRQHGLDPLMVGPGKTDYLGGLIHPEIHEATFKGIVDQFERESTALYGTAHLWDDGIIDPRDTRRVLAFTLSIARESLVRPLNPITFGVARM